MRPETELVSTGKAHIGVLVCDGGGYSSMCGHMTIALGRFLVDTHDLEVFPRRDSLVIDAESMTTKVLLHAPCGVLDVTVPVTENGERSDPSRPISFVSVPSFAAALDLKIPVPDSHHWPELGDRTSVSAHIAYGGAFYALISAAELGFTSGLQTVKQGINIGRVSHATALLKDVIMATPELKEKVAHPENEELSFLYGVIVVDSEVGVQASGSKGAETGLCFFADRQVDRGPTGSGVAARMAVAYEKGALKIGDRWTYHSLVSNAFGGEGGFVGRIEEVVDLGDRSKGVVVRTEGKAWYTGTSTFSVEEGDKVGKLGFSMTELLRGEK